MSKKVIMQGNSRMHEKKFMKKHIGVHPLFSYLCETCGHAWESILSSEIHCPDCESNNIVLIKDEDLIT